MVNAAQGLAYHPASTFLHRLNQKGGSGDMEFEKRPYPHRSNGDLIPFVSIVNRVAATGNRSFNKRAKVGDFAVNTLNQDLGFGYPEISKTGSHVKVSFVGYWHGDVGLMDPPGVGPYIKNDATYDYEKNDWYFSHNRQMVADIILGLAAGQSPLFANQGKGAAKLADVVKKYTIPDAAGGGLRLQRNTKGVQGQLSRLKGINIDDVMEPFVLPFDYSTHQYEINEYFEVGSGQELFIPAGATLHFNRYGTLRILNGGRITFGGVPSFSSGSESIYRVTMKPDQNYLPIYLEGGSKLKVPDPRGGLKFSLTQIRSGTLFRYAFAENPNLLREICPNSDLFCAYDKNASNVYTYYERIVDPNIVNGSLPLENALK
jgi:hypothetical protein